MNRTKHKIIKCYDTTHEFQELLRSEQIKNEWMTAYVARDRKGYKISDIELIQDGYEFNFDPNATFEWLTTVDIFNKLSFSCELDIGSQHICKIKDDIRILFIDKHKVSVLLNKNK
jgi:hypothetical protein